MNNSCRKYWWLNARLRAARSAEIFETLVKRKFWTAWFPSPFVQSSANISRILTVNFYTASKLRFFSVLQNFNSKSPNGKYKKKPFRLLDRPSIPLCVVQATRKLTIRSDNLRIPIPSSLPSEYWFQCRSCFVRQLIPRFWGFILTGSASGISSQLLLTIGKSQVSPMSDYSLLMISQLSGKACWLFCCRK